MALVKDLLLDIVVDIQRGFEDSDDTSTVGVVSRGGKSVVREDAFEAVDVVVIRNTNVLKVENVGGVEKKADETKNFCKSVTNTTTFGGTERVDIK